MNCLVDQRGYRECSEGSSKVLPCTADGPLESGTLYFGVCRKTSSLGITFQKGTVEGFHLVSFADADYASKATDRRSVSGGVVM